MVFSLVLVLIPKAFGTGLRGIPVRTGIKPLKYHICSVELLSYE